MFQGADVSGLDAMAQKAQDGADYAKKVAMALKILVRALKAMSWTGWAAGYAAYLEATVIPWVEATGEALENFAKVLRMASALQKAVSEDSPRVAIPASAYVPPQLPTSSAVNAPSLSRPDTAVANADMPTVSVGDGAVVVIPISIGGTTSSLGQTAATGAGGQVTTPSGVTVSWGGGTGSSGTSAGGTAPETRTTSSFGPVSTSPVSGAPVPALAPGTVPPGGAALGGGSSGGGGQVGSGLGLGAATGTGGTTGGLGPGGLIGGSGSGGSIGSLGTGGSLGGSSGSSGTGGSAPAGTGGGLIGGSGSGSGSGGGSGAGLGSGTGSGAADSDASSGLLGSTSRATTTPGDPTVRATPAATADAAGAGLAALGAPGTLTAGSSFNPAALAAPLGLAGLGAAGLGALRARTGDTDGGEELLD
ncbi:hypothetical protein AA0Y32_09880 [Georgenia phoenicis]|uniref:hypothetical protein n=1 Tax=unclassified Georgenia TaxID=2626815 RepID=UPI0039B093C6